MTPAPFSSRWQAERARTWLSVARSCRLSGDLRRAAMHLEFAGSLRADALRLSTLNQTQAGA